MKDEFKKCSCSFEMKLNGLGKLDKGGLLKPSCYWIKDEWDSCKRQENHCEHLTFLFLIMIASLHCNKMEAEKYWRSIVSFCKKDEPKLQPMDPFSKKISGLINDYWMI